MTPHPEPVIATTEGRARDTWEDQARGDVAWVTLLSGDRTPTTSLSAGIAEFSPRGGHLAPHRHREAEIYHVVAGSGTVTIEGIEHAITAGATVFIPGDAEHAVRNDGEAMLTIFYVFPTDSFTDVVYRFA